jgi:hypothetical protein
MMGCVPRAVQPIVLTALPIPGFALASTKAPDCEVSSAGLRCEVPTDKALGDFGFKVLNAVSPAAFMSADAKETIVIKFNIAVTANSGVSDLTIAQFVRSGSQRIRLVLNRKDNGSTLRSIVGTKESAPLPVNLSGQAVALSISSGSASLDLGGGNPVSVVLAPDSDQALFQLGTFQNIGGGLGSVTYSNLTYERTCSP